MISNCWNCVKGINFETESLYTVGDQWLFCTEWDEKVKLAGNLRSGKSRLSNGLEDRKWSQGRALALQFRSVKCNDSNEKMKSQDLYHTAEFRYRRKKSQDWVPSTVLCLCFFVLLQFSCWHLIIQYLINTTWSSYLGFETSKLIFNNKRSPLESCC